jgi:hypothetical protein
LHPELPDLLSDGDVRGVRILGIPEVIIELTIGSAGFIP